MVRLFTFGDSHSRFGWDKIKINGLEIKINHIGSKLMFSFGRDGLNCLNIKKFGVQNGDIVVFCFGEIDCRNHIFKYKEKGYQNVINEIVDKYFRAIHENVKDFSNLQVCIFNVVPPTRSEKIMVNKNASYPFKGTNNERTQYVNYMNKILKKKCVIKNYIFIDVFKQYSDVNGFLNEIYSDKRVHILNPIFIKQFINKNIINRNIKKIIPKKPIVKNKK